MTPQPSSLALGSVQIFGLKLQLVDRWHTGLALVNLDSQLVNGISGSRAYPRRLFSMSKSMR